jgi:hypothetical protein
MSQKKVISVVLQPSEEQTRPEAQFKGFRVSETCTAPPESEDGSYMKQILDQELLPTYIEIKFAKNRLEFWMIKDTIKMFLEQKTHRNRSWCLCNFYLNKTIFERAYDDLHNLLKMIPANEKVEIHDYLNPDFQYTDDHMNKMKHIFDNHIRCELSFKRISNYDKFGNHFDWRE